MCKNFFLSEYNYLRCLYNYVLFLDENVYDNLKENDVIGILNDFTEECFLLIKDQLRYFLENM